MEKVKFGIIGIKGFGAFHMRAVLANEEAELAAVCDIDEQAAQEAAEKYGIAKYYGNYRDLIADNNVDAVIIATPDQIHCEMTVAALEAGKHVLCEKPLALHNDDCAKMLAAAKRCNRYLMVGQECRCAPAFILAKEIYESGALGELFFVESEYAHDYSQMPPHWRMDKENPRHPVTGGGCHAIDLLRWFAGNPIEAFGYSNHKSLSADWPCDDSAVGVFKFENNVMGKVFVSTGCKRNYTMRTVIYGTKGTIVCDNTSPTLTLYLEEFEGKSKLYGKEMKNIGLQIPVDIDNHNVAMEADEFCKVIRGEKALEIGGIEGAATVAAAEAIIESARIGEPVRIDYSFLD